MPPVRGGSFGGRKSTREWVRGVADRSETHPASERLVPAASSDKQTRTPQRRVAPGTKPKRLAVVTMGVKLGDETRGYTRFRFLAGFLVEQGFEVDLITTSFQHWEKAQRDTSRTCYQGLPYRVVFIDEPGYQKNLDLKRIRSHAACARNLRRYFEAHTGSYDLIYAEIPPNDVARVCAESAYDQGIPFIADINDLWPEAMRMVFNVPLVSDLLFHSFTRDARVVYRLLTAAVGTSDEYANRPAADREHPYPKTTVYVGNDLAAFDAGVKEHASQVEKPVGETWAMYTGTLGASYDLETLVRAAVPVSDAVPGFRVKILGDGPDREKLVRLADELFAPVDFLGYTDYPLMAAYLSKADITVNSLVKSAPQSIVTKIGDYLAAGKPMVNTGSSPEFRTKVESDGFGINVEAEDVSALTRALVFLSNAADKRKIMGVRARRIAETEFDQRTSYLKIVDLINSLL